MSQLKPVPLIEVVSARATFPANRLWIEETDNDYDVLRSLQLRLEPSGKVFVDIQEIGKERVQREVSFDELWQAVCGLVEGSKR